MAQYEANRWPSRTSLTHLGYQSYAGPRAALFAAGERFRTRSSAAVSKSQQLPDDPDGRRTPCNAFEPSRRTFAPVFAHAGRTTPRRSARSALYPSITLSGTVGWTNSSGAGIVNPGKLICERRRIAPATDLQRQRQPCPREDRQRRSRRNRSCRSADAAQRRRRGQQRPHAVPVGPRQGRTSASGRSQRWSAPWSRPNC